MQTAEKIISMIAAKADIDAEEIKPESTWNEINLDSLDVVELIMEIENEFHISIPDHESHDFITVGHVIKYIESHE
jgi:acyl carrier protein